MIEPFDERDLQNLDRASAPDGFQPCPCGCDSEEGVSAVISIDFDEQNCTLGVVQGIVPATCKLELL